MEFGDALARLIEKRDLTQAEAQAVFEAMMAGRLAPAQIAAVLVALRAKGETVPEIAGAARAMRAAATQVEGLPADGLVDTCGTGGSGGAKLFNVSTAAAFVAAAAGVRVAKHGNRAATSKSGSADVLEAAGARLDLTPEQVARCVAELGVGFLFAPNHHPAMRYAGPVRRELGVGTLFNLLGPLTNPAGALRQVIGVSAPRWQRPLAEAARELGARHVLVVHSDGLDEMSIHAPSRIEELRDGRVHRYEVAPSDFDLAQRPVDELRARTPRESLRLVEHALRGRVEAAADVVALNAGAAIYVAGGCHSLQSGVARAQEIIASGAAAERFAQYVDYAATI